jgi:cyanophycinase-like exopeptidase
MRWPFAFVAGFAVASAFAGCGGGSDVGVPAAGVARNTTAPARGHVAARARASPPPTPTATPACQPKFYDPVGAKRTQPIPLHGPGLIMGGGGLDVNAEFVWMHDTLTGSAGARGGDVVVLRATGNNDYDKYIYRLAPFNSVRTVKIPPCSSLETLADAANVINESSALFLAGGNQADYVRWKNTPIQTAIEGVYRRGGVVGGTSAGEESLSQWMFDAVVEGNNKNVVSDNAVENPYERIISFTYDFLEFRPLVDVFADAHFVTRNRFGRLVVFMARQIADGQELGQSPVVHGLGIDEASGIVIDKNGIGTLLLQGRGGSAYFISGGPAKQIVSGFPFISSDLLVTKLARAGQTFDMRAWCGREPTYHVTVDGTSEPFYHPNPPYVPPGGSPTPTC